MYYIVDYEPDVDDEVEIPSVTKSVSSKVFFRVLTIIKICVNLHLFIRSIVECRFNVFQKYFQDIKLVRPLESIGETSHPQVTLLQGVKMLT